MNDGLVIDGLELWRGDNRLVCGLGFAAGPGSLVRVAGPNGSGKTTVLRAVCGLTQAESGRIAWRGRDIHSDLATFHAELAWLGHRDGLKPELTARENLRIHDRLNGTAPTDVDAAMDRAGIAHLAGLPVRSLSAGQKRRVALVRVFHSPATVWLLDEPFANLDADGQRWGLSRLRRHVAAGGICMLSTHLEFDDADVITVDLAA